MKLLKQVYQYILYFVLLFIPVSLFRDFTPDNELRYLSISNEMMKDGHYFILKNHGEIYSDKPPLYIWLINGSKYLFNEYHMIVLALFSIIPAFIIVLVMNKWIKNHLNKEESITGTLMLMTTAVFMGAAVTIRMDMLMVMFITLALYFFYRVYERKSRNKYEAYLIYLFIFLALFTKGPMGVIVPLLSIIIFLLLNKRENIIKDMKLYKGLGLLTGLTALWFIAVFVEGGKEYLYQLVYKQTVKRSINAFTHARPIYYYLKTMLYTFLPWTLFYLYGIFNSIKNYKKIQKIEQFFLIIIISTFVFLSLVSGKLDVYLLPIYCFLPFLSLMRFKESNNKKKVLIFTFIPSIMILIAVSLLLPGLLKKNMEINISVILMYLSPVIYIFAIKNLFENNYLNTVKGVFYGMTLFILFATFNLGEINKTIGLNYIAKIVSKDSDFKSYKFYSYLEPDFRNIDVLLNKEAGLIDSPEELVKFFQSNKKGMILFKTKQLDEFIEHNKINVQYEMIYTNKKYTVIKV